MIVNMLTFQMNVVYGNHLKSMIDSVANLQRRDCHTGLMAYINGANTARVCTIYGLRRTGKTTLLWQAMLDLTVAEFRLAAYIKAQRNQTMRMLEADLEKLYRLGYRYVFIDEVTFLEDFIDTASCLSDIYAAMGMKIILTGADSLGLWLAGRDELYDRTYLIHTTWISFPEHARLIGDNDIDDYIRYGGILHNIDVDYNNLELKNEEVAFRDDKSTRQYIDTAICQNIQNSLKCYHDGMHFRHLQELLDHGELASAIRRVIASVNHQFTLRVLTKTFETKDLGKASPNHSNDGALEQYAAIQNRIDTNTIAERLMSILDGQNASFQGRTLTNDQLHEIEEYLRAIEVIAYGHVRYIRKEPVPDRPIILTQPGMCYCQALALIHSLINDPLFDHMDDAEKNIAIERLDNEIKEEIMVEIVQLATMRKRRGCDVFKLVFDEGEYDMVVYDHKSQTCQLYTIKHSEKMAGEQVRYLVNADMLKQTAERIAPIAERCVVYLGPDAIDDNGVRYLNVDNYLSIL